MPKIIRGYRLSSPDASGYPDRVQILNGDTGDMVVYDCPRFRTNPNPYQPSTGKRWSEVYAQIAPTGTHGIPWVCTTTPKHGKCIALNSEAPVPTLAPDPNNGGKMFALAVLIHCGQSPTWSGSMACQALPPDDFAAFIAHFDIGEAGIYILTDETNAGDETVIQPLT